MLAVVSRVCAESGTPVVTPLVRSSRAIHRDVGAGARNRHARSQANRQSIIAQPLMIPFTAIVGDKLCHSPSVMAFADRNEATQTFLF